MDRNNVSTPFFSGPPAAATTTIYQCDSCRQVIPPDRPRVRCLICHDYDSCADCHIMQASSGSHTVEHQYEIYRHGQKLLLPIRPPAYHPSIPQSQPTPRAPDAHERQVQELAEAERQARELAEAQDRLAAAQVSARMQAESARFILGGWTVDEYGNRTYESGLI